MALGTPVLEYELQSEVGRRAAQEKGKRTKNHNDSPQNSFEPLQDLHEWAEYTGEFKPVLLVQAAPQLRETFMSVLGREIVPSIEPFGTSAPRLKFRTDFYRMKLFCGAKEIEPIQPGKAATVVHEHNSFVNVTDATYVGIYSYPPDAISPTLREEVTLQTFFPKRIPANRNRKIWTRGRSTASGSGFSALPGQPWQSAPGNSPIDFGSAGFSLWG